MRLGWTPRVDSLKLVNYTRIDNAHKARKKTVVFDFVAVLCTITKGKQQIWASVSRYDQPLEQPINEEARIETHIASTGVQLY